MNPFLIFVENYKSATAGLPLLAKAFVMLILLGILLASAFAIIGSIKMIF